jgi:hypothetical protein
MRRTVLERVDKYSEKLRVLSVGRHNTRLVFRGTDSLSLEVTIEQQGRLNAIVEHVD